MKILIVDDEHANRKLLSLILKERTLGGIHPIIIEAANGLEAVDRCMDKDHHDIDIILMDISMPIMDGQEAAKIIKKTKTMPIICTSAFEMEELISRYTGIRKTFDGFILKPFNWKELTNCIEKHHLSKM